MPRIISPGESFLSIDKNERKMMADALKSVGFNNPDIILKESNDGHVGFWLAYPHTHYKGSRVVHRNLLDQYLGSTVTRALASIERGLLSWEEFERQ